jgi:putative ABC transport system permease protein
MLTTGRMVAAERQVLASIDSAGTRTITIHADDGAGLTSNVLGRIASLDGIEWAAALSSAVDATNLRIPDGARVPARYAYGTSLDQLGVPSESSPAGEIAYASSTAMLQLGVPRSSGAIALTDGSTFGLGGELTIPDFLRDLQPLVIIPDPAAVGSEPVSLLIIIADSSELVSLVSDVVLTVLSPSDPSKVSVRTSEALAELRADVHGELNSFSRGLVLALTALTGTLEAILLYGLVLMRRKDFGRRRALGATRTMIVALLLTQTALLSFAGLIVGASVSFIALSVTGAPPPDWSFTIALATLFLVAAVVAALAPAVAASRRAPIQELRVA